MVLASQLHYFPQLFSSIFVFIPCSVLELHSPFFIMIVRVIQSTLGLKKHTAQAREQTNSVFSYISNDIDSKEQVLT